MLIKKEIHKNMHGVYTTKIIKEGTVVFSYQDWIQDEKKGWFEITVDELEQFDTQTKRKYLKYSYDRDFGILIGTLDYRQIKHISNFLNHSCNPNLVYSGEDMIIAKREILAGEELTLDYGSFIVNVDQDFLCGCNSLKCRHQITKNDWQTLHREGMRNFPMFIINKLQPVVPDYAGIGIPLPI